MKCPKCNHTGWQAAEYVHRKGLSTIHTKTRGTGAGIVGGSVAVGTHSSTTHGVQQTELSKHAAPPAPPPDSGAAFDKALPIGLAFGTLGSVLLFGGILELNLYGVVCGLVLLIVPALQIFVFKGMRQSERDHKQVIEKWRNKKMCTRCGHIY